MRKHRKLGALLLAVAAVLGLAATALAAEEDAMPYTDVSGWAQEYIDRVTELGLMDGKTEDTFAPGENMTRADLVTALYRLDGKGAVEGTNPFTDVDEDAPYRDAVVWANGKGIVSGKDTSGTTFDPDGDVKRQEIAKILNVYASQKVGAAALTNTKDVMSAYPDAAEVSSWAVDCMNWAVASEFITGSNGKLDPKGTATRAQTAKILCAYLDDNATGDASKDDPRNGDGIGENELLVVSFGTSYNDNRVATIKAVEDAMEAAFPGYSVRRGFTANIIIDHVYRRDGERIDDVKEALDRAKANGVKNLLVQPTHLMNGYEYGDLVKLLGQREGDFESVKIGAPLLTSDDDFAKVAQAMVAATAEAVTDGKTAVCYMGHGTAADSNSIYSKMQQVLTDGGHTNYFIGTVESAPTAEDLVKVVKEAGYEKVVLRPMMIVAGDHANNDMAGDEEDSWKSVFEAAGLTVVADVRGLGELAEIQQLLADHAKAAKPLAESAADIAVQPNPESGDEEEEPAQPSEETAKAALADGVYTITVECAESMFKIDSCELTVQNGKMTAALTLGSTSFDKMIVGSAAAAKVNADAAVDGAVAGEKATFTLSVESLDEALSFAAHSVKRDEWYDRTLTFVSGSAVAK